MLCLDGIEPTATSRVSLLPWLSVVRALRMGGSFAVSNLTVHDGEQGFGEWQGREGM